MNASREVLVCSKKEGAIEGYLPSCGLLDGQIIGAEIIYDSSAVKSKFAMPEKRTESEVTASDEKRQEETEKIPPAPAWVVEMMEKQHQDETSEKIQDSSAGHPMEPESGTETEDFSESGNPEETGELSKSEDLTEEESQQPSEAGRESEDEGLPEPESGSEAESGTETKGHSESEMEP